MSTNQMVLPKDWVDMIRLIELRFVQAIETVSVVSGIPREQLPPLNEMSEQTQEYITAVTDEFSRESIDLWLHWRNAGSPELVKSQTAEEFLTETMGLTLAPETPETPEVFEVQSNPTLQRVPNVRPVEVEKTADRLARLMAHLRNNPDWDAIDPISRGKLFDEAYALLQENFNTEDDGVRALEIATFRAKWRNRPSWADTPAESQEWLLSDAKAMVSLGF
jgi:hypothetical protein